MMHRGCWQCVREAVEERGSVGSERQYGQRARARRTRIRRRTASRSPMRRTAPSLRRRAYRGGPHPMASTRPRSSPFPRGWPPSCRYRARELGLRATRRGHHVGQPDHGRLRGLHAAERHTHGPADQGRALAGPDAHDDADAVSRAARARASAPSREDDTGPAVPRVLDLTLRIGELLLAGGEGAEDVEAAMFGVAHAYGLDRCEPTVTFTLLSITYQPSLVDDPVTAQPYRAPPRHRLHPAGGRLPARRRHHPRTRSPWRRRTGGSPRSAATGTRTHGWALTVRRRAARGRGRACWSAAAWLGLRRGRARRDARRPAGLAGVRARAAGVLPVRGRGDAARRDGRRRSALMDGARPSSSRPRSSPVGSSR